MPQMSPMNWFILFLYFNYGLYFTMLKVFFISKIYMNFSNNYFLKNHTYNLNI